jgi:hypothetical protein
MEEERMLRYRYLSASLIAALGAAVSISAHAQDPAAVGSGGDPALVGDSMPVGYAKPRNGANTNQFTMAALRQEDAVDEVETLLNELRSQMSGTGIAEARNADHTNAVRLRNDAETLIRKHWSSLGPLTRDLYSANYNRTDPNIPGQRSRSPYGDGGQLEAQLLGGAQDAQDAMQKLEDLLLPMLKDLKQGFDDALNQRAPRR